MAYKLRYIEDNEYQSKYNNWDKYISNSKNLQLLHPKNYIITENPAEIRVEKPGQEKNFVAIHLMNDQNSDECKYYGRRFEGNSQSGVYYLNLCKFRIDTGKWFVVSNVTATLPRSYDLCHDWTEIYTVPESIAHTVSFIGR